MNFKISYIGALISGIFLGMPEILIAQDDIWWDDGGEIRDAEVVIEKEREIELPPADRNYEMIPPLPVDKQEVTISPYDFSEIEHPWGNLNLNPRALRLKNESLDKLYGGYLKAGGGNYMTSYLEGHVFNKRNKNFFLGLHAKHLSGGTGPVDKKNSADGHDVIGLTGKSLAGPVKIGGIIRYHHDRYHFYGYPDRQNPEKDSIRQRLNTLFARVSFENNTREIPGDYRLNVDFHSISDRFDASENQVKLHFEGDHEFDEKLEFRIKADALLSKYQNITSLNRNLFRILPYANYDFGDFDIDGGLNVIVQNDTLQTRNNVLIYPVIGVNYDITNKISAFLRIDGDLNEVTYNSLIRENPYLNDSLPILHSNKNFGLDWGFEASLGSLLSAKLGISLSNVKDMYFFINDTSDASKFNIIYDNGNVSLTDIYCEILLSRTRQYTFGLEGHYFNYTLENSAEAWHKPAYTLDFISQYNLRDKINLSADLYLLGGIMATDELGAPIHLDNIIDLNLKIDYLFSEKFSAFLRIDNILGNSYQLYHHYPVRGIQVMGGVSASF